MVAAWRRGETPALEPGADRGDGRDACAEPTRDPAFAAEALTLPSEAFLADQMAVADVDAIHAVREHRARRDRHARCATELRATYDRLTDTGRIPHRRRLDRPARAAQHVPRLSRRERRADGIALAKAQFDAAQNMTDVLAALAVLSAIDCPERTAALDAFYARWHDDDLVLDKWFAIQAMSPLPGTPEAVRALRAHPDFDLRNPEPRARAGWQLRRRQSGALPRCRRASGYRFLADTIIALDPMNSQVAARLVPPLGQWRRVDAARQALMKQELQRILDAPG